MKKLISILFVFMTVPAFCTEYFYTIYIRKDLYNKTEFDSKFNKSVGNGYKWTVTTMNQSEFDGISKEIGKGKAMIADIFFWDGSVPTHFNFSTGGCEKIADVPCQDVPKDFAVQRSTP